MATTGDATSPVLDEEGQRRLRRAVPETMLRTPYLRLPFRAELTNDGTHYHGGVIAAVMDTTGAAAAWSNHDFTRGTRASTVSMSVQYVGAAKNSDLVCEASAVRRGRELVFTEITCRDAAGAVTAHGVQTYRIV